MEYLATAAQMKELDRTAIEAYGVPSLGLMECAARAVADEVHRLIQKGGCAGGCGVIFGEPLDAREQEELEAIAASLDEAHPRIGVLCGPGNNGGDGIAAARLLMERGYCIRAFLVGEREKMTPDARAMEEKLIAAGGQLEDCCLEDKKQAVWLSTCACIVDALFGVGLSRPVGGDFLAAVRWMNRCFQPVVSCDIPSGVHTDTGEILGEAVRAACTVTFTYAKPGLWLGEGAACSGDVRVKNIGIPDQLTWPVPVPHTWSFDIHDVRLPHRRATAHKGDFGKLFILAGSEGYTGAPVLAANAAVRSGAGLVFLGVPREIYPIVAGKCDEAMPFPLPEEYDTILAKAQSCDVALIGPGLGRTAETKRLVMGLLRDLTVPVVLDADGINALSGHIDVLDGRAAPTVLTPHDGEFQRLTGCDLPIQDRLGAARDFAEKHGCVLVLKGHGTVTAAPDGTCYINSTGNPGMAKGGSGDVLSGVLAALLGQKQMGAGENLAGVTAQAVCLHGAAGDMCARELGEYAMTPGDMIAALPKVMRSIERRERVFKG